MMMQMGLYVQRVASKDNLSDDPSREQYALMQRIGARYTEPCLHEMYEQAQSWAALSLLP